MRRLTIEHVTPALALVRGYAARELITDVNGRPPIWATRARGWVVQPHQVADIVAEAERRFYEVFLSGTLRSDPDQRDRDIQMLDDRRPGLPAGSNDGYVIASEGLW